MVIIWVQPFFTNSIPQLFINNLVIWSIENPNSIQYTNLWDLGIKLQKFNNGPEKLIPEMWRLRISVSYYLQIGVFVN